MSVAIRTARLEIVAAEPHVALAEAAGTPDWYRELAVPAPRAWPPPLNDAESVTWYAGRIATDPAAIGWFGWYVLRTAGDRVLVGNCGFKGRPDTAGSVEIGYSLLPDYQRRGFGTELAAALVTWAFGHPQVARVMAETLPDLTASVRVLEKNGFQQVGRGSETGTILFELRRAVFERRRSALNGPGSRGSRSAES
jgi:ribosomal-protein-alanine N-acetyltransferase